MVKMILAQNLFYQCYANKKLIFFIETKAKINHMSRLKSTNLEALTIMVAI